MSDKDIYLSLRNIDSTLYYLYRKLEILELNHKENSEEYDSILKTIEYYKKIEDGICYIVYNTSNPQLMLGLAADATLEMCGTKAPTKLIHDPSFIVNNKIHPEDLVSMRISARMHDLYIHFELKKDKDNIVEIFDTFYPQKTKYFLDILTEQSNDPSFKEYRKILLDAKYDFAFVNYKESICNKIKDENIISANSFRNFTELIEYVDKYSKLNKATMLYPKNIRRFLLGINYIRANLIQMQESNINDLKTIVDFIISSSEDENGIVKKEGITAFGEILSFAEEDKEKYNREGFSFKRRF